MFGKNIFNKLENSFKAQNKTWIQKNLRVYIEPINLFDKYKNELYYKIAVESINMWANAISEFIDIKYTNDIMESHINIRWELSNKTDTACTLDWTEDYKIYGADITISLARQDSPEVVKALVLHTIGHSLGLVHSVNKNSVMSESYKAQNICEDDIKQIEYLYKNR